MLDTSYLIEDETFNFSETDAIDEADGGGDSIGFSLTENEDPKIKIDVEIVNDEVKIQLESENYSSDIKHKPREINSSEIERKPSEINLSDAQRKPSKINSSDAERKPSEINSSDAERKPSEINSLDAERKPSEIFSSDIERKLSKINSPEIERKPSEINSSEIKCNPSKVFPGLTTQEPWPKDVKLFQPYEVEQILLPDNANCLAVQAFLKMSGLEFQVECRANAEYMSPSGKVPFIKCGAFVISELEGIVQFVNNKGVSLTNDLENEQKSDMRAYMSLVHNVLENAELYICWCDKETYDEVTKPRNGSVYPWPLNLIQTWSKRSAVIKRLKVMGWYNKSLDDVYQEVENCCQALSDRLEKKDYFFGKKGSELDALVYSHIHTILSTPLPINGYSLARRLEKFDSLVAFCKRVDLNVMGRESDLTVKLFKRKTKGTVSFDRQVHYNTNEVGVIKLESVGSPHLSNNSMRSIFDIVVKGRDISTTDTTEDVSISCVKSLSADLTHDSSYSFTLGETSTSKTNVGCKSSKESYSASLSKEVDFTLSQIPSDLDSNGSDFSNINISLQLSDVLSPDLIDDLNLSIKLNDSDSNELLNTTNEDSTTNRDKSKLITSIESMQESRQEIVGTPFIPKRVVTNKRIDTARKAGSVKMSVNKKKAFIK